MPSDPTGELIAAVRVYLSTYSPHSKPTALRIVLADELPITLPLARCQPVHTIPVEAEKYDEVFIPNAFQEAILEALEGKALRTDALGAAAGDRSRLFRNPGGLKELQEQGLVKHNRRAGFYRPDAPPDELQESEPT